MRPCYQDMLNALRARDEVSCIENAAIGPITIFVFLKAIRQFCHSIINVRSDNTTYESRNLYEVVLSTPKPGQTEDDENKPVIIIDAGQQAGSEPVGLALFVIEQLTACQELNEMIQKVRWVILPSANPDGLQGNRFVENQFVWRKNLRPSEDQVGVGVDISRNFDTQWAKCDRVNSFSQEFPGLAPATENETIFIKNVLNRYKKDARVYLSMRRDGHAIMYPYAHSKTNSPNNAYLTKVAGDFAVKVNQRAGGVQIFINDSIFNINGKAHCGHSVDYAYDLGIPLSFEMRVFLGADNRILSMFQTLPKGYEASLRSGYFGGIRELYNTVTNDKKYGRIF